MTDLDHDFAGRQLIRVHLGETGHNVAVLLVDPVSAKNCHCHFLTGDDRARTRDPWCLVLHLCQQSREALRRFRRNRVG